MYRRIGPSLLLCSTVLGQDSPATLRPLARDFYEWQTREFPVDTSGAGLHTYDGKLTDYSPSASPPVSDAFTSCWNASARCALLAGRKAIGSIGSCL